jgi:hypothetical protein
MARDGGAKTLVFLPSLSGLDSLANVKNLAQKELGASMLRMLEKR